MSTPAPAGKERFTVTYRSEFEAFEVLSVLLRGTGNLVDSRGWGTAKTTNQIAIHAAALAYHAEALSEEMLRRLYAQGDEEETPAQEVGDIWKPLDTLPTLGEYEGKGAE